MSVSEAGHCFIKHNPHARHLELDLIGPLPRHKWSTTRGSCSVCMAGATMVSNNHRFIAPLKGWHWMFGLGGCGSCCSGYVVPTFALFLASLICFFALSLHLHPSLLPRFPYSVTSPLTLSLQAADADAHTVARRTLNRFDKSLLLPSPKRIHNSRFATTSLSPAHPFSLQQVQQSPDPSSHCNPGINHDFRLTYVSFSTPHQAPTTRLADKDTITRSGAGGATTQMDTLLFNSVPPSASLTLMKNRATLRTLTTAPKSRPNPPLSHTIAEHRTLR
jgi:hypothetical protein